MPDESDSPSDIEVIKQRKKEEQEAMLDHGQLPDPIAEAIMAVLKENSKLKQRIKNLENTLHLSGETNDADAETEPEFMTVFMKNYKDGDGI